MSEENKVWRKCSACKKDIGFGADHYVCSVSTCNSKRTGYKFCSISCFEAHVPGARHKSAGAVEEKAPLSGPAAPAPKESSAPPAYRAPVTPIATAQGGGKRRIVSGGNQSVRRNLSQSDEVLIIASRFKEFIKKQSDLNCSQGVLSALSNHIRMVAMQAADNAQDQGRKTLMEYDFDFLKKINFNINNVHKIED